MIILQTGVPGSGKTASVVNLLMTDETYTHFTDKDGIKKQRPLFVNGINELQVPHQLLDDEQIRSQPLQDFLPYGSLVIIDEAQRLMGTRSAASKVPEFIEALAMHRHHGLDIVLITQHPSFLDPFVRKLVQRHMHISIKAVGRKLYEWNECVDQPDSPTNIARAIERQFTLPKKTFGMYKSAEVHTKVSRRIPKSLVFLILFLPVLFWFGLNTFGRLKAKYSSEPVKVEQQETAKSQTSSQGMLNNQNATYNNSLRPEMFAPTIPEKPESKPLYDSVRQVKTFERVAGCVKSSNSCNCYSQQGTILVEISENRCLKYVKDGLPFNPYKDESQAQQAEMNQVEQSEQQDNIQTESNEPKVLLLGGEHKVPKTENYPDNLRHIQ